MAHVAMQEADERGEVATWGEHVTDQEYAQAASATSESPKEDVLSVSWAILGSNQ
jgi:hypothetical protein